MLHVKAEASYSCGGVGHFPPYCPIPMWLISLLCLWNSLEPLRSLIIHPAWVRLMNRYVGSRWSISESLANAPFQSFIQPKCNSISPLLQLFLFQYWSSPIWPDSLRSNPSSSSSTFFLSSSNGRRQRLITSRESRLINRAPYPNLLYGWGPVGSNSIKSYSIIRLTSMCVAYELRGLIIP